MNVTVALLAGGGGGDGAVEEEEHAARQKPRTNAVKSRIMIVPFCDRNEDLESILGLALTPKVDILHLRRCHFTESTGAEGEARAQIERRVRSHTCEADHGVGHGRPPLR